MLLFGFSEVTEKVTRENRMKTGPFVICYLVTKKIKFIDTGARAFEGERGEPKGGSKIPPYVCLYKIALGNRPFFNASQYCETN